MRYRQVLLLLVVLLLPTLVIIVQGRRLVDLARTQAEAQAKDEAKERQSERQKRMAAEIGQEMYATLEAIKGREMTNSGTAVTLPGEYSDNAVVLVGHVDGDRLSWPWDAAPTPPLHSDPMEEPEFDRVLRQAERVEFRDRNYPRAIDLYRNSIEIARAEGNRALARFGLARALARAGARDEEVTEVYREILELSWNIVDDALYPSSFAKSAADVQDVVRTAIAGTEVSEILEGPRRFALVVRLTPAARTDAEAFGRLPVGAPSGLQIPLRQLGRIEEIEAPAVIGRENGMRSISVEANVRGRDTKTSSHASPARGRGTGRLVSAAT